MNTYILKYSLAFLSCLVAYNIQAGSHQSKSHTTTTNISHSSHNTNSDFEKTYKALFLLAAICATGGAINAASDQIGAPAAVGLSFGTFGVATLLTHAQQKCPAFIRQFCEGMTQGLGGILLLGAVAQMPSQLTAMASGFAGAACIALGLYNAKKIVHGDA